METTGGRSIRWTLPYLLFAALVCVFLWKPIFTGRALLPGDYLMQMAPWKAVESRKSEVESPHMGTVDRGPSTAAPGPQWNPLQWDAIAQFYPWRVFYARSMKSGHIPLWNPHQFSGTPFLANGQSACLYPPNLIFLAFDAITAFTILAALHLFLAQVFMYWLMRELGAKELGAIVAAIVFAFSAFMVLWLELPTFVSVAVWLPLALLLVNRAVERRSGFYGMLSGLAIGLAFLAGHFQIAFYVVLATGLWWLWKMVQVWRAEGKTYSLLKVIWPLVQCVVVAGLIAAPQMLPTQELAANSHRVRAVTEEGYQAFVANGVPAYRLVTAFAPRFFGDPSQNSYYLIGRIGDTEHIGSAADYMEYGLYAGVLPLMLALIALGWVRKKYVGFFVLLTALALLTALGTPINRLFYFGIPGFSSLGGPNRILLLYFFGVAALAGFGADIFCEHASDRIRIGRRERPVGLVWGLLALHGLILCSVASRLTASRFVLGLQMEPVRASLFPVLLIVSDVVLLLRSFNLVSRSLFSALVVTVLAADLFAFGISYNPTCERWKVYPQTRLTTELKRLTKNGERIAPINPKWSLFETPKDAILPPNAAMVYGLYDVQGYDSLYMRGYQEAMAEMEGVDPSPPENGNMILVKRFTDKLHWRFFLTQQDLSEWGRSRPNRMELLGSYDGVRLYSWGPPLRLFQERAGWSDGTKTGWDGPSRFVISGAFVEAAIYTPPIRYGDRGWIARLNGRRIRTQRLDDGGLATFAAEPGKLVFSYEPFTFRLGMFLLLVGVGAIGCVGVYRMQRHRIISKR